MASHFAIRYAAHQIRHGGVIVYPTETVYGLGCDPMNFIAIDYLNQLKQRGHNKSFILLAHRLELFDDYISELSTSDKQQLSKTREPTSWIVPAKNSIPDWLTNPQKTVAIRISPHPVVKELCQQLGHPIVSTSANPGGKKTCRNSMEAHKYFHGKVDAFLIDDQAINGKPSIIKQLDNLLTVRP